eukprot:TRINITY_DN2940_c0_g1_i3.p1 TRINITY_DN2940_c0_g1~~TRINITY_DN2940_c0_g1_i3.p1  ORF type:complete len:1915 (+),score=660.86 TRINITY_DN2940_c0_g1_i3:207-5951(+)
MTTENSSSMKELEEKLVQLKKCVEEEEGGQNRSTEKFDILWDLESIVAKTSKEGLDGIYSDFMKYLQSTLSLGQNGTILTRLIVRNLNFFLNCDPNYRTPLIVAKNIQTCLSKASNPNSKCAFITALGELFLFKDRSLQLASVLVELIAQLLKYLKAVEVTVKVAALDALKDIVQGGGQSSSFIHTDVIKGIRPAFIDKSVDVRVAACECMLTVANLTTLFSYLDGANGGLNLCLKNLEDPSLEMRNVASKCLGKQIALALLAPPPKASVIQQSKKPITIWNFNLASTYITSSFLKSTKKESKAGLSQAYVSFLQSLPRKMIENNIDFILNSVFGFFPAQKSNTDDVNQIKECVSFILKNGLVETMGETGHQLLAKSLTSLLGKKNLQDNEGLILCAIEELNYLILKLGDGIHIVADSLQKNILPSLVVHYSEAVRYHAALSWRCLATSLPHRLASFITECLAKSTSEYAISTVTKTEALKPHLLGLQGFGIAAAALIAASPAARLGVPNTVLDVAFQSASGFLRSDSSVKANIKVVIIESGWNVINSLMTLGTSFAEAKMNELFQIWNRFLGSDLQPAAGGKMTEKDIRIFAVMKSDALASLHGFIVNCPSLLSNRINKQIVTLLSGVLSAVVAFPEGKYAPATVSIVNYLKHHLVQCFGALPTAAYSSCFVQLLRFLAAEIIDGSQASLKEILHQKGGGDAILGPWLSQSETSLQRLVNAPSKSNVEFGLLWKTNIEESFSTASEMSVKLVQSCIQVFGSVFALQSEKNRLQLIDHFFNSQKNLSSANRVQVQTNVLGAILCLLKEIMKRKESLGSSKLQSSILEYLKNFVGDQSAELRRGAGEAIGMLSRIDGDQITNEIMKWNQATAKKTKEANWLSGCAFVQGCVNKYVGGMRSGPHLRQSVALLHDIIRDSTLHSNPSTPLINLWALHSLCLTTESAGASFGPFVNSTLGLLTFLMIKGHQSSSQSNSGPLTISELRSIASVANAIVHAMGPELSSGTIAMKKSTAIITQLREHENAGVQCGALDFQQSLVLFAPHTVDIPSVVSYLCSQFQSTKKKTRRASLLCFRQLIQHELISVYKSAGPDLEQRLFMMLDGEQDDKCRNELKLILTSILDGFGLLCPTRWIQLCKQMVCTSSRSFTEVEEKEVEGSVPLEEKQSQNNKSNEIGGQSSDQGGDDQSLTGGNADDSKDDSGFVPRWHTKLFSMECICRLFNVVESEKTHFDLSAARQFQSQHNGKGDFMVFNVPDLISMSFVSATSEIDIMKPTGIQVLKLLIENMGSAIDPDYAGHSLLEQYQAQFMSALRPCFNSDSPPDVTQSACSLLLAYLRSPIIRDNRMASKLISLIVSFSDSIIELNYKEYNEECSTMVQLAVLGTLARMYNDTVDNAVLKEKIFPSISQTLSKLKPLWLNVLRDYAVLTTQSKSSQRLYQASFFTFPASNRVIQYYQNAYSSILLATTSLVCTEHWNASQSTDNAENNSMDETSFFVMLGICVNALSGSFDASKASISLRAIQHLIQAPQFKSFNVMSHDVCKELVNLIQSIIETEDIGLQIESVRLMEGLIKNLPSNFFQDKGVEILKILLDSTISTIQFHIPQIYSQAENITSKTDNNNVVSLLEIAIPLLAKGTCLLPSQLRKDYGPITLFIFSRVLQLPKELLNSTLLEQIKDGFFALISLDKEDESWKAVVHAAFLTLVKITLSQLEAKGETSVLFLQIVLSFLKQWPEEELDDVHKSCLSMLKSGLTLDPKIQISILQSLRMLAVEQSNNGGLSSLMKKYFNGLMGDFVLLLWRMRKQTEHSPESINTCNEAVRLIVTAQALSKDASLLGIVIPTLVGLLDPAKLDELHNLSLQVLLKLASSSPEFKTQVSQLSDWERNQLETSVKINVSQAQQAAAKAKKDASFLAAQKWN